MGSLGVKSKSYVPSESIKIEAPSFEMVPVVTEIEKPSFTVVNKNEIVNRPVFTTKDVPFVVEIPKPELENVNIQLADLEAKLNSLCNQVPELSLVKTEIKETVSPSALVAVVVLSACNLVSLGVIAWLLN